MEKTKTYNNMTEGKILRKILLFALPIFVGNVFQQLYNVADTAVIGNVLGDEALASVGAAAPVYNLVVGFANGLTNGFAVVIARFFGANDEKRLNKSVSLTYVLTAIISVVLTLGSIIALKPLLHVLNTPKNIIGDTEKYLQIILIFSVITMAYNMLSGMMRAIGNSRTPLYFLIIACGINIILDIIFVKGLSLGIAGAAYATVIAQLISVILCIIYILSKCRMLMFKPKNLEFDTKLIGDLTATGMSMGLMLVIVSIGSVIMQSAINSLGSKTITAHTAARKIDDIFMLPLGTISMAASTFASQNFGAGKMDRVKKGITYSIYLAFAWSGVSCLFAFFAGSPLIRLLTGTKDAYVIKTAIKYIRINLPFFFVLSVLLVLRSSLQGLGRKLVPITGSIIEFALKIIAVGIAVPTMGYLGICILEPVIWCICAVVVLIDFFRFVRKANKKTAS
ncbi:MAG: MATE family efflux transporter [Lachnospiraceae bacterium]